MNESGLELELEALLWKFVELLSFLEKSAKHDTFKRNVYKASFQWH